MGLFNWLFKFGSADPEKDISERYAKSIPNFPNGMPDQRKAATDAAGRQDPAREQMPKEAGAMKGGQVETRIPQAPGVQAGVVPQAGNQEKRPAEAEKGKGGPIDADIMALFDQPAEGDKTVTTLVGRLEDISAEELLEELVTLRDEAQDAQGPSKEA